MEEYYPRSRLVRWQGHRLCDQRATGPAVQLAQHPTFSEPPFPRGDHPFI